MENLEAQPTGQHAAELASPDGVNISAAVSPVVDPSTTATIPDIRFSSDERASELPNASPSQHADKGLGASSWADPSSATSSNTTVARPRGPRGWQPSPFQPAGFPHIARYRGSRGGRRFQETRPNLEYQSSVSLTPEEQQVSDNISGAMKVYRKEKQRRIDEEWERRRNVPLIGFMVEDEVYAAPEAAGQQAIGVSSSQDSPTRVSSFTTSHMNASKTSCATNASSVVSDDCTSDMLLDILTDLKLQERRAQPGRHESDRSVQGLQTTILELQQAVNMLAENLQMVSVELQTLKQKVSPDDRAHHGEKTNRFVGTRIEEALLNEVNLLDL